jgi:ribose transport system permease protein
MLFKYKLNKRIARDLWNRNSLSFIALILIFILSIFVPRFLSFTNISNIIRQSAFNAIIAAGMTFVILSAGIDLSVGSIVAVSSCVTAGFLKAGHPILVSILIGIGIGFIIGLVNGILVSKVNIPAFIATLGTMGIGRGIALVYTQGAAVSGLPVSFLFLGRFSLFGFPLVIYVVIIVYIISFLILKYSLFGLHVYATGGNEYAAYLSGVKVQKVKTICHIISGSFSAISGILLTARLNSAQPVLGIGYELDAIAAVVIGGTSLFGGKGSIIGTLLGALIMGMVRNSLNLLDVSSYTQQIVIGIVLIIAVGINVMGIKKITK